MSRLGLTGALAIALSLAGCRKSARPPHDGWPPEGKKSFLDDCRAHNPDPGLCDCVGDRLEKAMPWSEFSAMRTAARSGQPPDRDTVEKVRTALESCQHRQ